MIIIIQWNGFFIVMSSVSDVIIGKSPLMKKNV